MPIRKELLPLYRTPEYLAARAACRDRAGDACQQCGRKNRSQGWHYGWPGHAITVQCGCAHLDNDPTNNAPENLAWLCRGCHLAHDRLHHKGTRSKRKDAARPLLQAIVAKCDAAGVDTPQVRDLKAYLATLD